MARWPTSTARGPSGLRGLRPLQHATTWTWTQCWATRAPELPGLQLARPCTHSPMARWRRSSRQGRTRTSSRPVRWARLLTSHAACPPCADVTQLALQSCWSPWLPRCPRSTTSWCAAAGPAQQSTPAVPRRWLQVIMDSIMCHFRVDFSGRGELADRQQKLNILMSRLRKARPARLCAPAAQRAGADGAGGTDQRGVQLRGVSLPASPCGWLLKLPGSAVTHLCHVDCDHQPGRAARAGQQSGLSCCRPQPHATHDWPGGAGRVWLSSGSCRSCLTPQGAPCLWQTPRRGPAGGATVAAHSPDVPSQPCACCRKLWAATSWRTPAPCACPCARARLSSA